MQQLATGVDLIIVAIYLLLMVAIGFAVSIYNKDDSDFFRGGNIMPWWLAGISLFMSSFSAYTFTGAAGLAYRAPAIAIISYLTNGLGYILGFLFLAPLWRRSRSTTIFSYMTERYGIGTNQVYSWTQLAAVIVQAGVMLLALSKFVSVALGTDLSATIVVCGLVIAVYCLIGGLWAVVVTDTLQFMVVFPCAIVIMILALMKTGGFGELLGTGNWRIPDSGTDMAGNPWSFNWSWIWAYLVMMIFASSSGAAAQRYFSVKKERDARKVALLTAICMLVAPVIWLTPSIATRVLGLDLSFVSQTLKMNAPEEAAYVVFCLNYLPAGAIGVVISAMLAATMSSLSGQFNAFAAVITEDIVHQVFWKTASGKALLVVGRVMTMVLGGLVVLASLAMSAHPGGVFALMLYFSGVVIIPAGIPIVMGLFYRRTPPWAGIVSYMTGLGLGLLTLPAWWHSSVTIGGIELVSSPVTFQQQIFVFGTISAIVYFLPGLFMRLRGSYQKQVDQFFAKIHTPIEDSELRNSDLTDVSSYLITGWTTVGMGLALSLLFFLDLPFSGKLINLSIGVLMTLFGLLFVWMARVVRRKQARARAARGVRTA